MFEQISGYIVQLLDSSIYLSIGRMDWLFECKHLLFHLTVSENVLRCYPEAAMCAVLTDFRISTFYTMTSAFIQLAASSHYSQARYPHTHNLTLTRFDWFAISKSKTKCECDECQWERKIDSISTVKWDDRHQMPSLPINGRCEKRIPKTLRLLHFDNRLK